MNTIIIIILIVFFIEAVSFYLECRSPLYSSPQTEREKQHKEPVTHVHLLLWNILIGGEQGDREMISSVCCFSFHIQSHAGG